MSSLLRDMPLEHANRLYLHPLHQAAYSDVTALVVNLRQCTDPRDFRDFQEDLLAKVLNVQEHRAACVRVVKRLKAGKSIPIPAPVLGSDLNPADVEAWQLEVDVCDRVDRELRSVGDGLAWRAFGYDRRAIVAPSRNDPAGPLVGKAGLAAERDFVRQWSSDEDSFVLLHDLTACLRIGDATRFERVGDEFFAYLYEVKTDPQRRVPAQLRRQKMAEEAVRGGGELPGESGSRLIEVDVPYETHLAMLADAFELARTRGVQGMRIPGGRALVAADLSRGYDRWTESDFLHATGVAYRGALKRAGILNAGHHVHFRSDDLAARSPIMPPWAIYPLPADRCSSLVVDMAMYVVTISSESLIGALNEAGLDAEWTLPAEQEQIAPKQVILRARLGDRMLEMRPSDMQRLLLELVSLPTWVATVTALLTASSVSRHPWPFYADEQRCWA